MKNILVGLSVVFQVGALVVLGTVGDTRSVFVLTAIGVLSLLLSLVLGKAPRSGGKTEKPSVGPNGYFDRYIEYIREKHGDGAAARTRGDVEDLLGNKNKTGRINELVDERGANARVKGLVVGRVQSGKTQNFTGLITKAIDKGWRVILVLTSNNTALKDQTVTRLENDLLKSGLDYKKRDYELINGFCGQIPCVKPDGITIGIALKEKNHLEGVSNWLKENANALGSVGILVIDDEADNATQNSGVGEDVWSDETVRKFALELVKDSADWRNRCVGEWLENLVNGRIVCSFTDQEKSEIEGCVGKPWLLKNDDEGVNVAKKIINDYADVLHIKENVSDKSTNCFSQPLSACIENCFCGRGENRSEWLNDFRAIMRWLLDVRQERSAINRAICNVVDDDGYRFAKLAYVGYTATPYANILNERHGAENPLDLDFIQSMELAPEYFGLKKIFGDNGDEPNMPIVKEIPNDECSGILAALKADNVKVSLDGDFNYGYTLSDGSKNGRWLSLNYAIAWAFCGAAVRRAMRIEDGIAEDNDRSERWTTMLVNLSRKKDNHDDLRDMIRSALQEAVKDSEKFKNFCLLVFDELATDLSGDDLAKKFPNYGHKIKSLSRDDVEKGLPYFISKFEKVVHVESLNSNTDNRDVYNRYIQAENVDRLDGDHLWIVVGGNRISRGLTFDGLVSTYFDRERPAVTVETLTQMGRWFGYRVGYELLPRVWAPTGLTKVMKEICLLEEELHKQIHDSFERGEMGSCLRIKNISRRLTGRDAGRVTVPGVENPAMMNDFDARNDALAESVALLKTVLSKLGPAEKRSTEFQSNQVYGRINYWCGKDIKAMGEIVSGFRDTSLRPVAGKIDAILGEVQAGGVKQFNVVLADPDNKTELIELGSGISVHYAQSSEAIDSGTGVVSLDKFVGQYDAWKAVLPVDVIEDAKVRFGNRRVNTVEAMDFMFSKAGERYLQIQLPVLQIGLVAVPVGGEKVPGVYLSLYWPGRSSIVEERMRQGSVLDTVSTQTAISAVREKDIGGVERKTGATSKPVEGLADTIVDEKSFKSDSHIQDGKAGDVKSTYEVKRMEDSGESVFVYGGGLLVMAAKRQFPNGGFEEFKLSSTAKKKIQDVFNRQMEEHGFLFAKTLYDSIMPPPRLPAPRNYSSLWDNAERALRDFVTTEQYGYDGEYGYFYRKSDLYNGLEYVIRYIVKDLKIADHVDHKWIGSDDLRKKIKSDWNQTPYRGSISLSLIIPNNSDYPNNVVLNVLRNYFQIESSTERSERIGQGSKKIYRKVQL